MNIEKDQVVVLKTHSPSETLEFGKNLGALLRPGMAVGLIGDLAAGKTWLAKGISYGLGIPEKEYVNSPAFDIVHEYPGEIPVFHMDFYRIETFSAEDRMWLEEYLDQDGVVIIEWADKFIDQITSSYLAIKIDFGEQIEDRILSISSKSVEYGEIIRELSTWQKF